MKKNPILSLKPEEFSKKLLELKEEYFNLRFQHGVGQLEKNSSLKITRRNIARLKTIMKSHELSK
jgi:large subunit ribosomal protein L29